MDLNEKLHIKKIWIILDKLIPMTSSTTTLIASFLSQQNYSKHHLYRGNMVPLLCSLLFKMAAKLSCLRCRIGGLDGTGENVKEKIRIKHETKNCQRCGDGFECKSGSISLCQCQSVLLTPEQLEYVATQYSDCLCHRCLVELRSKFNQSQHQQRIHHLVGKR